MLASATEQVDNAYVILDDLEMIVQVMKSLENFIAKIGTYLWSDNRLGFQISCFAKGLDVLETLCNNQYLDMLKSTSNEAGSTLCFFHSQQFIGTIAVSNWTLWWFSLGFGFL